MRELNFFRTLTHTLKSDYAHALENEKRTCAAERKNWYEEREQLSSSIQEIQRQLQVYGLHSKFLFVHERTFIHRIHAFFLHRFLFTPALRCPRTHMRKFLSNRLSSAHAQNLIQQENKGERSGHSLPAHSPLFSPANNQECLAPCQCVCVTVCACECVRAHDHNAPTLSYPTQA